LIANAAFGGAVPELIPKKLLFLLFNVGMIICVILRGNMGLDAISIAFCVIGLGIMNGVLWISARKFKDWK
jgi:hypothetical protein